MKRCSSASSEQTSNRRQPGSSRTEASALAPMPSRNAARIDPDELRTFGTRVLMSIDVPEDDAALVTDSLVQADLWGHQSHGFLRLPWYVARLRSGAMRATSDPAVLSDTGPLLLRDGRDGIGQVLTEQARTLAV